MEKIFFVLLLFISTIGFSQGPGGRYYIDFNNIDLPESPTASSLGTYGDIPVNTATGVPNINIPLYVMEVDGLSIPVSLSYHASGVKVNDIPTAVGLKWTLNAGGIISRTVKSKPDELGWLTEYGPFTDDWYDGYDPDDWVGYQSWFQQLMMGNLDGGPFRGLASIHDHNPDEYNYNFIGFGGEFITDRYGDPIKNQDDELTIFFNSSPDLIKDQNGNSYYFGGAEETSNRMYVYASTPTSGGYSGYDGYDIDGDVVTGWMLDSIVTKNNKKVYFDYEPYTILEYDTHIVANHISINKGCGTDKFAEHSTTSVTNDYTVQLIKEINSEFIKIEFVYDTDNSLSLWKKRLKKITVNDLISGDKKEFKFDYDKFSGDPRLKLEKVYEVGYKNNVPYEKPGYEFEYNPNEIPPLYSLSQDFFGYYNGASNPSLAPKSDFAQNIFQNTYGIPTIFYTVNTGDRSLNSNTIQNGVLTQIKYPTGGVTNFTYDANAELDKYCGGLRVSKIENKISPEAQEASKTTTYTYSNLFGDDFESNVYKSIKYNYDKDGVEHISTIFNSSFVIPNGVYGGYFYENVTTNITENAVTHKKEDKYELHVSTGKYNFVLKSEKIFNNGNPVPAKITEYEYAIIGEQDEIEWNILGNMRCLRIPRIGKEDDFILGYGLPIKTFAWGNSSLLPIQITTTEYLNQGSGVKPVTVVQFIDYDDETLLKISEKTSTRYKRESDGSLTIIDQSGEEIITNYTYPWSMGINLNLPAALPIGKKVVSTKYVNSEIYGQYFEYDNIGNIKRVFHFNKGEIGNTSSPSYVPNDYEEMTNLIYENGKPVQVWNKSGEATTYIWGLKGQFPVAKIEGKARAGINQTILQAVENATYAQLPGKLDELRNDPSVDGAMLTTYTYKPLAGVETITDPKGDKMTFHYDAFGRLDYVEDRDGNILSENEYHYRLQP